MLKLIAIFLLMMISLRSSSQQTPKFVYCDVIVVPGAVNASRVTITVDFGQKMKFFADNRMKDESGKPMKFNSLIDALNSMAKKGWEFVQSYPVQVDNHFLMRKPFDELDDEAKKEYLKD